MTTLETTNGRVPELSRFISSGPRFFSVVPPSLAIAASRSTPIVSAYAEEVSDGERDFRNLRMG